jgi:peptidoglycan/LPS O-acetylase OafA/YrhL
VNAVIIGFGATVLVLCSVLLDKADVSLRWRALIVLGDASYVIYLIHPYCEEALNKFLARELPFLRTTSLAGMLVGLAVTIAASLVVYRFVDNPLHLYFRGLLQRSPRLRSAAVATAQSTSE